MTPIQGNSSPVTRKRTKWRSFPGISDRSQVGKNSGSLSWKMLFWFLGNKPSVYGGAMGCVLCPRHQSLRGPEFMLALTLRQRHKDSWKVVLWTIRNDFLHLSGGSPKCWNFHGKPLHSCLGMGDINHDICLIKNYLLHCLQMPRIIHRTNTIFLLSTKRQRHSWLIQRCFSKINASFRAFRELAGQNSSEGNSSRADDLREKGRKGTVQEAGPVLQKEGDQGTRKGFSVPVYPIPPTQWDFSPSW